MLRPFETDQLNLYPVSNEVDDPKATGRKLVEPAGQRVYPEYRYTEKVFLKLEGMGSMKDNPDRKPVITEMKS